jgi:hypothetical protein
MQIIIAKDEAGIWRATRDAKLELAVPSYYRADDLAKWCKRKYPQDQIGITAKDVGPHTAATTEGPILWLSQSATRWPYLGGGRR